MSLDWSPLILAVAPNGAHKTKCDHPALPITPDEIAATAAECCDAGASMIHLHVRDSTGKHSLDPELYGLAIKAIRQAVSDRLVIQVSSEAVGKYTPVEQMAVVRELRPESVSIALRELIPNADAESAAAQFLEWVITERIIPQFIFYSVGDVLRYNDFHRRGIVPPGPYLLLFVLGRYAADQTSQPNDLLVFLSACDGISPWGVCAFGKKEHACALAAATLGGHARVGFENNLYLKDGRVAENNAMLVAQVRDGTTALGRSLADANAVRQMLAI
ncbi:MAG: 3-keto-5-aminohexanoate cleavage protein [Acidiferrobacterales bacterium]